MSKPIFIQSMKQFDSLLSSSRVVVTDFWAEWCAPCKAISPFYESLSEQLSRRDVVTFTKVNVDEQSDIAKKYEITAMPTFMIFKNALPVEKVVGAGDVRKIGAAVEKLLQEKDATTGNGAAGGFSGTNSSGSSGKTWLGAALPRGYKDVTDQIDVKGLDLLNADSEFGGARTLFEGEAPRSLGGGEGREEQGKRDWVESDTDEQLMLFLPFQSSLKIHSLHITSLMPESESKEAEEEIMRPKTIHLYSNRAHTLGFDEAESVPATQSVTLRPSDWDAKTGTAKVELRFVKFQNVTSLVVFVGEGEGDGERTRVDRIRVVGETGEKREMGKLEKIGEGGGE